MSENMYCSGQIANSSDFEKNYDEIDWKKLEDEREEDIRSNEDN